MRLYAQVGSVEIRKFPGYDQKTGAPDPGYILQATVTDLENPQALYQCSFDAGFGLEDLKEARKNKASEDERDQIAASIQAQAKQWEGQRVELFVKRAKAKGGFLSLQIGEIKALQPEGVQQSEDAQAAVA